MIFRRKGKLRKEYDEKFLEELGELKNQWLHQKEMTTRSFEPSEVVLQQMRLAEAKYFYAFKEARRRKIRVVK